MQKIRSAIAVLALFLSPVTFSAATELGFKSLNDPSPPPSLRQAAKSVYKVIVALEETPGEVRVMDLDGPQFREFLTKLNALTQEQLTPHERIVVQKQIERCVRDNLRKTCPLFLSFQRGTAFLAGGDGSFLLTNAHIAHRFLQLKSLMEKKSILDLLKEPQFLPIFLFDQSGKLVFDPFLTPPGIIRYGQPSLHALLAGTGWYGDDSDYVVIQLPSPLGQPLKIAKSITASEMLYRPGFASCTGCVAQPNTTDPQLNADRTPHGNSNGRDLYWTAGRSYTLTEAAVFLKAPPKYFENSHQQNWVFFEADAQVGMSGGPILNSRGEVVGVFAGSKPMVSGYGAMKVLSRGVRPPEFN